MRTGRLTRDRGKVQVLSIGIVAVVLVLAALLVGPLLTSARDLSTPTSRLVGHWESQTDRVMTHAIYGPVNASGEGACYNPDGTVHFTFKVLYEDPTGMRLVLSEGENEASRIETEYVIAPHGRSMTKEYKYGDGNRWVFDYEYIGPR